MTRTDGHLSGEDEADLVALADGCLYGARRTDLEARMASDPALADALAQQRAALAMLASVSAPPPHALRERIGQLESGRRRGRRRLRRRWLPASGLAVATVAAAVLVLVGGGPAVDDVLAVGARPATASTALGKPVDGVWFPTYEKWRTTGERTDVVDGRATRTVFYERDGRTIAYTIVAGPALEEDGTLHAVTGAGGRTAVTWTRRGRTCVISGSRIDARTLAGLAVWG
jgi:anti-sigma factor RsiW